MNKMDKRSCGFDFNILVKGALSKDKEGRKYITCHRVISILEKYRVGREGTQRARVGQFEIGPLEKFSLRERWYLKPGRYQGLREWVDQIGPGSIFEEL